MHAMHGSTDQICVEQRYLYFVYLKLCYLRSRLNDKQFFMCCLLEKIHFNQ